MTQGEDRHRQYEDLAVSHVLGGLDETDSRLFRSHLLECPDCRARVGELRAIAHELADVERAEQRARAAQTLETKERDDGAADQPRVVRPRRRGARLLTAAVVILVLGLSLWNFTLRGTVARLQDNMDSQAEAASLMEFGVPGLVLTQQDGVEGQVRATGSRMALLMEGLDDTALYGVYLQDRTGQVLFRAPARSHDGRLLAPLTLPDGAHSLLVTAPQGALTAAATGTTVLHVRLPEEADG